jgi:transcriptional repressor NF-X1
MRACKCGKSKFQVKCSSKKVPLCEIKCDKFLNCNLHKCEIICHEGECDSCQIDVELKCFSHDTPHSVKCGSELFKQANENLKISCELKCEKTLDCGKHNCQDTCHDGPCNSCPLLPSKLTHCPCTKTQIKQLLIENKLIRTSCTDPVPTCRQKCQKVLKCNELNHHLNDIHLCEAKCHIDECPACEKEIEIECRCGRESKTIKCCMFDPENPFLCTRKCQKKKTCGRHVCNEQCCTNNSEHICMQLCGKLLNCGLHRCEDLCHKGPCKKCLVASFDERICPCGRTIQYPPIKCGTQPLDCPHPCSRHHLCEHPVTHSCHWEEKCPPCSFLTSKMCMGEHEKRFNIPCYMKDVSCGKLCGKPLPNCAHKCEKTCHRGPCVDESEKCGQLCQKERPLCGHKCNSICHGLEDPCPDTICQELVILKCRCGLKGKQVKCLQRLNANSSQTQLMFENLASQIKEMLSTKSIDLNTFKNEEACLKKRQEFLECDEECLIHERNKSLAQALQIDPNQALNRLVPIYSDFLKNFAREDPKFVLKIEKQFEQVIQECKSLPQNSNNKKKSLNFPVMKSHERRLIHELAAYYDLESSSFDPEPFRHVCVYATKEKSIIPSVLLSQSLNDTSKAQVSQMSRINLKQIMNRDTTQIQHRSNFKTLQTSSDFNVAPSASAGLRLSSAFSVLADELTSGDSDYETNTVVLGKSSNAKKDEKVIDYFDMTD